MNRDDSDRIQNFFAASSRDLTPASARRVACVLYAPISDDPEVSRFCASVLSEAEQQRAERLSEGHERAQFEQRRAFRHFCAAAALRSSRCLSEILFQETDNGRPYVRDVPDLRFSFSSCRLGVLGAWSSTHGIGVDLEDATRDLEARELARQFFSAAEAQAVASASRRERLRTFYQLWTLKEAALKSIGEGLPLGLDAFEFELDPTLRVVRVPPDQGRPERFDAYRVEGTAGCAALAIRS